MLLNGKSGFTLVFSTKQLTANKYLRDDIEHIMSAFAPQCSMEYIIINAQEIIEHMKSVKTSNG